MSNGTISVLEGSELRRYSGTSDGALQPAHAFVSPETLAAHQMAYPTMLRRAVMQIHRAVLARLGDLHPCTKHHSGQDCANPPARPSPQNASVHPKEHCRRFRSNHMQTWEAVHGENHMAPECRQPQIRSCNDGRRLKAITKEPFESHGMPTLNQGSSCRIWVVAAASARKVGISRAIPKRSTAES